MADLRRRKPEHDESGEQIEDDDSAATPLDDGAKHKFPNKKLSALITADSTDHVNLLIFFVIVVLSI